MTTIRDVLETKGHSVYCIGPDATIQDAVVEMCRLKVGALLVSEDHHVPAGILSERDLLVRGMLECKDPATTKVGELMTPDVICVDPNWTVPRAMSLMTHAHCRHLPVVEAGELVGLISIGDLVREVGCEQADELRWIHEYVEGKYPG